MLERRAERLREVPRPPAPPTGGSELTNPIDRFVAARWKSAPGKFEAQLCDEPTFLRRVYLDVIGVIPTVNEVTRYLGSPSTPTKREKLIDQLLARDADYAAHWTPFWEDALASQNVVAQGGIPTHGNYREWLLDNFARNRPFDLLVAELLDPTMPGRKPPESEEVLGAPLTVEYVRNEDHTATLQTAANVAQVFLGTSMKCAGCHDHFENSEWPQDRFLAFAGLFAPQDLEKIRCEARSGKFVPARFPFDLPNASDAVPAELTGRLHLAAQSIVDPANPRFARTIVNRLWKRYLGLGLFEPIDDYREDVPASHPELLEWLAYDFMEHGYDLKHTIRLILTSRTYQLRYDPEVEDHFSAGEKNAPRYFRSPSLRRLTAEQFLDSVRVATSGTFEAGERTFLDSRSTALARALGRPASRNEISTARPDDVAIVQSLELLNGRELRRMIYGNSLFTEGLERQDPRKQVDRLYRIALSRPATAAEKNAGKAFLQLAETPVDGMQDMLWALVCSPEFQYIK
ncbi:MAG: DUF1553 domain-containing protein [Planctomycetaceae bacterium]|nr:DUF1553 domain-containing protein [Planctomycetaceae bacterium]